jgi:hypothetical protein
MATTSQGLWIRLDLGVTHCALFAVRDSMMMTSYMSIAGTSMNAVSCVIVKTRGSRIIIGTTTL